MTELLIQNASTLDGETISIAVSQGRITAVGASIGGEAERVVDANGRLVMPSFVNAHLHVDKALTVGSSTSWEAGTFQESIDMTLEFRRDYSMDDLLSRGRRVLDGCIASGTGVLRAFGDVGTVGGLRSVEGLLALKEEYLGRLDIQVVAFPQEGFFRDPGADELVAKAMGQGCDVVGAFPWFEYSSEHSRRHVEKAFEIARDFDADIHAFVDDEPMAPTTFGLEQVALATIANGWEGRVTVSHACGLASYDDYRAQRTMQLVASAGVSVVSNAHISLVSKCQHAPEPKPRGITRVRELMAHGVNVATAQDDIADPYYPFGRGDMLEVAGYLAHVAQLYRPADAKAALEAITYAPARALRLRHYGLAPGSAADLVILDCRGTASEVLRLQPSCRWVIKAGRVVAETVVTSRVTGGSE